MPDHKWRFTLSHLGLARKVRPLPGWELNDGFTSVINQSGNTGIG